MDKNLFFYELEGRGYTFHNKNWDEAKHGFEDDMLNMAWEMWSSGQVSKAQVPEGFVLIKNDTKTVVAIERTVEQQVEASGMDSRRLERLDGWRIIEAATEALEPTND